MNPIAAANTAVTPPPVPDIDAGAQNAARQGLGTMADVVNSWVRLRPEAADGVRGMQEATQATAPLANAAARMEGPQITESASGHAAGAVVKGLLDTVVENGVNQAIESGAIGGRMYGASVVGSLANVAEAYAPEGSGTHTAAAIVSGADLGTAVSQGVGLAVDAATIGATALSGDTGAAMRQADRLEEANLSGQNGLMVQGYTMAVGLATDPASIVDRVISDEAAGGAMGPAVGLGNALGDRLFHLLHGDDLPRHAIP